MSQTEQELTLIADLPDCALRTAIQRVIDEAASGAEAAAGFDSAIAE